MDLWQWHCRNRREKKLLQLVCGNAIAEIRGKICGNCGNVIAKNGRKKKAVAEICEGIKKKILHPQYFYNKSHVISYY